MLQSHPAVDRCMNVVQQINEPVVRRGCGGWGNIVSRGCRGVRGLGEGCLQGGAEAGGRSSISHSARMVMLWSAGQRGVEQGTEHEQRDLPQDESSSTRAWCATTGACQNERLTCWPHSHQGEQFVSATVVQSWWYRYCSAVTLVQVHHYSSKATVVHVQLR